MCVTSSSSLKEVIVIGIMRHCTCHPWYWI